MSTVTPAPIDISSEGEESPNAPSETQPGKKAGRKAGRMKRRRAAEPVVVEVAHAAGPARMKRRHFGAVFAFLLMVVVPMAVSVWYLWTRAEDRFVSTVGFTVRADQNADASLFMGGLAQITGSNASADTDVLFSFIHSATLVQQIDNKHNLAYHYGRNFDLDPVFSLDPDATLEDKTDYWQRMVTVAYDGGTNLIEVSVSAFDPDYALTLANAILSESQDMINGLNVQAREDAMGYALQDLDAALARLKQAREAMTQFRTRTQIVDPQADIQSRMGVMNNLQETLAEALIAYDLLLRNAREGDPRLLKAQQEIEVIRQRIASERESFATDGTEIGTVGEDYPTLIAEFESLKVDLMFAEETYHTALTAVDAARAEATRQSRYLATFVRPVRAQSATEPEREILALLIAGGLLLLWAICALVYYSLRDRG